jgi:rhodanese-related sulfurtransferase
MNTSDNKKKRPGILTSVIILAAVIGIAGINHWQNNSTAQISSPATAPTSHIFQQISPEEANKLIQQHREDPNFIILDVRTPGEFQSGHVNDAINIDFYSKTFRDKLNKLNKDNIYLIYCRSGNRSNKTLDMMKSLRFTHAYNMVGGITRWIAQELPVVK